MCEWAVQESQYFHLAADYVRSKLSISRSEPLVEDETLEALAPLSRFSLTEVVTLLCAPTVFQSIQAQLADRTAELAKGYMIDFENYRGFVPHILPLCIQLLGRRRGSMLAGPTAIGSVNAELLMSLPLVREWEAAKDPTAQLCLQLGDVRNGTTRTFLEACSIGRTLCQLKRRGTKLVFEFNPRELADLLNADNSAIPCED
jgi:hypothetical protein